MSRFTEAQIIRMIKEQETGMPTADVCRRHGLSSATFYTLKAKHGGLEASEAARLKAISTLAAVGVRDFIDITLNIRFEMRQWHAKRHGPGRNCNAAFPSGRIAPEHAGSGWIG